MQDAATLFTSAKFSKLLQDFPFCADTKGREETDKIDYTASDFVTDLY